MTLSERVLAAMVDAGFANKAQLAKHLAQQERVAPEDARRNVNRWTNPKAQWIDQRWRVALAKAVGKPASYFEVPRTGTSGGLSRRLEDAVEELVGAAQALAATGEDLVALLGELRPLLEQQKETVARLQSAAKALGLPEAANSDG